MIRNTFPRWTRGNDDISKRHLLHVVQSLNTDHALSVGSQVIERDARKQPVHFSSSLLLRLGDRVCSSIKESLEIVLQNMAAD